MLKRGFIVELPKWANNGIKFFFWITFIIHRFHYPSILLATGFSAIIAYYYMDWIYILFVFSLIETLYLSIALHETFHMTYAKMLEGTIESVTVIPYTLEIRTNFNSEKSLPIEDFCVILFVGPIFPLLFSLTISLITYFYELSSCIYLYVVFFSIINILSLLPLKGNDGWEILNIIKKKPGILKLLPISIIYIFVKKFIEGEF